MKCFRYNRLYIAFLLALVLSVAGCSSGSLQTRQSARAVPLTEEEFNKSIQLKVWDRVAFGNYVSFDEAKKIINQLGIKSKTQYSKKYKLSKGKLPSHPANSYKINWKGWGDFVGTGYIQPSLRNYVSFREAKEFAL